jgi:hypothetical protein
MLAGSRDGMLEIVEPLKSYLVPASFVLWLVLSLTGKLPGTARHRKSFVDHAVLLERRE